MPLQQLDPERVVADHRLDQAVAARHVVALAAVGAEQAIEDDQHAAVVGVEVLEVGGVVDAVRRRRVEHVLEPAEARDPGGVDPELVEQVEREHLEDDARLEAEPDQRHVEDRAAGGATQDADPVRRRQVELVGRVVHGVVAPEPAHAVRGAVEPVVAELLADEEGEQGGRAVERDGADAVPVGERDQRRGDRERQEDLHRDAREQVEQRDRAGAPVVRAQPGEDDRLGERGDDHPGQGDEEQELVEAVQHRPIVAEGARRASRLLRCASVKKIGGRPS